MSLPYRQAVVGVFTDASARLLVGERADLQGEWQFPQGGIDAGESPLTALKREMQEELGTKEFIVAAKAEATTTYDFPPDFTAPVCQKYRGQCQHWFKLRFLAEAQPLLHATDGEFRAFHWLSCAEVLAKIIAWKREAYCKGLISLGLLRA